MTDISVIRKAATMGNVDVVRSFVTSEEQGRNEDILEQLLDAASRPPFDSTIKYDKTLRLARRATVKLLLRYMPRVIKWFFLANATIKVHDGWFDPVVVRLLGRRTREFNRVLAWRTSSIAVRLFSKYMSREALERAIEQDAIKFELTKGSLVKT